MYRVSDQGVDERMINVHYYHYYLLSLAICGSDRVMVLIGQPSASCSDRVMVLIGQPSTSCVICI